METQRDVGHTVEAANMGLLEGALMGPQYPIAVVVIVTNHSAESLLSAKMPHKCVQILHTRPICPQLKIWLQYTMGCNCWWSETKPWSAL